MGNTLTGDIRKYSVLYNKLKPILKALGNKDDVKLTSKGLMDLNVDRLYSDVAGATRIAIAHNYILNGDVMCDPDMEIMVYPDRELAEAVTYQDNIIFQQVYFTDKNGRNMVYPQLKKELNSFLRTWLVNLKNQGFFQ